MKKTMKHFMMLAVGFSFMLAGCSKDDDSKLAEFIGTYPVEIKIKAAVNTSVINRIKADIILSEENGDFKASANLAEYGNLNIVLSDLNPDLTDLGSVSGVTDLSGYVFKVAEQTITLASSSEPIKIKGYADEEANGYHGGVLKGKVGGVEHKQITIFLEGVDTPLYLEIMSTY